MNWINEIKNKAWKKYSQAQEEGYINYICANIPNFKDTLVDLGAGLNISNTRWFIEHGWWGLRFDGEPTDKDIIKAWITKDNVCQLLKDHDCPKEFGLLSIDLDGMDGYILESLFKEYRPMVVVAEFNGTIPVGESRQVEYNENHVWGNDNYYGFSFDAGVKIFDRNGYKVIFQNNSLNMYAVRKDLLTLEQLKTVVTYVSNNDHKHNPIGKWVEV